MPPTRPRPRFLAFTLAILAVTVAGGPLLRVAAAKEHTASCPELATMIARVRSSLTVAGSQRQRGSSLGAYQVLRSTLASMVRDSGRDGCGALGPTLRTALKRAATSRSAVDASVELDLGLESALALATDGHMPHRNAPPKLPAVAESVIYGLDCPDLFPLTVRLEGPRPQLPERVSALLADLVSRPRCPRVRSVLESARPDRLAHAVDSIRLDEPNEATPAAELDVLSRCPELPLVIERIAAAIDVGAPQFNSGDAAACRRTYESAARIISADVIGESRCPAVRSTLATGLARAASAASDGEAAWALRRSFDAVLGGPAGGAP
ncbi:MAG TPA: hypothetical protein VFH73_25085 [Polyangia bacterium]|nr:hypothetical protein [Polyangia bacterium]